MGSIGKYICAQPRRKPPLLEIILIPNSFPRFSGPRRSVKGRVWEEFERARGKTVKQHTVFYRKGLQGYTTHRSFIDLPEPDRSSLLFPVPSSNTRVFCDWGKTPDELILSGLQVQFQTHWISWSDLSHKTCTPLTLDLHWKTFEIMIEMRYCDLMASSLRIKHRKMCSKTRRCV